MSQIHIPSFAPEVIFHIGPIAITNTIINVWMAILVILELLLPYFDQVTGDRKKTMRFLPIVGSIFFFILLSNWLGLLPGTGSLKFGHNFVLRPANSDLNLTLAMALVSVISSHVFGFITVGVFTHLGKFVQIGGIIKSFRKGQIAIFTAIIEFFVVILEIISEIAKILSLS